MPKKQTPQKPAKKDPYPDTVLVKLRLSTSVRRRLRAYATMLGVNMNVAAEKILDEHIPTDWEQFNRGARK